MGKHSIAPGNAPRKDIFTASELAEMARFDAALEAEATFLTKEELALAAALDREAKRERRESPHQSPAATASPRGSQRRGTTSPPASPTASPRGSQRRGSPHPALRATFPQGKAKTAETAEHRAARLEKKRQYGLAHREERIAYMRAYNEAHRQERREYQRAYDAAHKAEINARRRAKYAAKKGKEKEHG